MHVQRFVRWSQIRADTNATHTQDSGHTCHDHAAFERHAVYMRTEKRKNMHDITILTHTRPNASACANFVRWSYMHMDTNATSMHT